MARRVVGVVCVALMLSAACASDHPRPLTDAEGAALAKALLSTADVNAVVPELHAMTRTYDSGHDYGIGTAGFFSGSGSSPTAVAVTRQWVRAGSHDAAGISMVESVVVPFRDASAATREVDGVVTKMGHAVGSVANFDLYDDSETETPGNTVVHEAAAIRDTGTHVVVIQVAAIGDDDGLAVLRALVRRDAARVRTLA